MLYRDQPLDKSAFFIPRVSTLFRKRDTDYCRGDKQVLVRATTRKELDLDAIEVQLTQLAEQPLEKD